MSRNPDKKRCGALTAEGERCRRWAMRGQALCYAHAEGRCLPGADERHCTARLKGGERCRLWATPGSEKKYGRLLCASHVPDGHARRMHSGPPEPGERRCEAITQAGKRCPHWALRGQTVCHIHAEGRQRPQPGKRRCTAVTKGGARCRNWAVGGTEDEYGRLLCAAHLPAGDRRSITRNRGPAEGQRRCTAVNLRGERCRRWVSRGQTLCRAHAEGSRLPGPGERRCTAVTQGGEQCPQWAVRGTEEEYGRLLCSVHLPEGDPRKNSTRMPEAGERRCTADNLQGQRCRRWALVQDEQGRDLCWLHTYPDKHGKIRHGYYRATPPLSVAEWAAVELARASGSELQGEIVFTRLLIRMLLAYVTESELPLGQDLNSVRLIMRNVRALARLLLARRELEGPLGAPERDELQMRNIARELAARRRAAEGEGPPQEALTGREKEALLLLWQAGDHELMRDIGVVRIMLRRVLGYVSHTEGLSVAERIDLLEFFIMGAGTVVDLMRHARSLRPRRKM